MIAAASQRRTIALVLMIVLAAAIAWGLTFGAGRPVPPHEPLLGDEREVSLPDGRHLMVQVHEVTVGQWNRCAETRACTLALTVRQGQIANHTPATGLSHADAREYVTWLNDRTGFDYRLPNVAEWSFFAAAVVPDHPDPIFTDPALRWASGYRLEGNASRILKPQGSFAITPDGIADLDGSVWEWTDDCFAGNAGPVNPDRCPAFYVAGEHIAAVSFLVRDPARGGCAVGTPPAHLGLRLVRDYDRPL